MSSRGLSFRYANAALTILMLAEFGACRGHPAQPVTVNYLQDGWVQPTDMPAAQALSREFTQQTGIKLELIRGVSTEPVDQLSLIRKLLKQDTDRPDVVEIDETWLGTVKDDLADLRPYFQREAESISPTLSSSYVMDGKVLALSHHNQAGALEYRADLLRKYGYDHPPRTWTELEAMSLRIQAGERAHGRKDFWGYIWPGATEESLTCNALEWQVDEGGGQILEGNGVISVDNPAAIRAWQRARHWIGWISPPDVTEYREVDTYGAFESGRSAFVRVWVGEAGVLSTRDRPGLHAVNWWNQPAVGEAGFAAMPGGSVARVAALGGAGLAISKYSKHPKQDAILIRFVLRKELESFESKSVSRQPVIYDALNSPQAKNTLSIAEGLRPIVIARPTNLAAGHYDDVSKSYSRAVHAVLAGQKRAPDAAYELEQDLVKLTGLPSGPPVRQ